MPQGHVVHTGKDGRLEIPVTELDAMFTGMAARPRTVLHFHGGLVSRAKGVEIAERLVPQYAAADAYPVFFVWESGLVGIIKNNVTEIAGEDIFTTLLKWVAKFVIRKVDLPEGAKSVDAPLPPDMVIYQELAKRDEGGEPFAGKAVPADIEEVTPAESAEFERRVAEDPRFRASAEAIIESLLDHPVTDTSKGATVRYRGSAQTLMDEDVLRELRAEAAVEGGAKGIISSAKLAARGAKVLYRVVKRFRQGRAHGLYPTIVEELLREFYLGNVGAKIWGAMKKETADTFEPGFERGGREFVSRLAAAITAARNSGKPDPDVVLVGHSAGAIFINNLLAFVASEQKAGKFPADFSFRRLALLAPACTCKSFAEMVKSQGGLLRDFRMFSMTDAAESNDSLVPYVYTRSLLYFISGVLETEETDKSAFDMPLLGMQRYQRDSHVYTEPMFDAIRTYLDSAASRSVWSPFSGGAGLECDAKSHGDFDNNDATIRSLQHFIRA